MIESPLPKDVTQLEPNFRIFRIIPEEIISLYFKDDKNSQSAPDSSFQAKFRYFHRIKQVREKEKNPWIKFKISAPKMFTI